jgi:hypothetical protein
MEKHIMDEIDSLTSEETHQASLRMICKGSSKSMQDLE